MPALEKVLGVKALAVKGWSQGEIANAMQINQSTVSRWLKISVDPELLDELELRKDEPEDIVIADLIARAYEQQQDGVEKVVSTPVLSENIQLQYSIELDRLNGYSAALQFIIDRDKGSSNKAHQVIKAIEAGVRVSDRRAKYLGLDTPLRTETSANVRYVIDGVDTAKLKIGRAHV